MSLIKIGIVHESDLNLGAIIMALYFEKLIVSLLANDHCSLFTSKQQLIRFSSQFVVINFINYETSVISILFCAIVRISINIVDVIDI